MPEPAPVYQTDLAIKVIDLLLDIFPGCLAEVSFGPNHPQGVEIQLNISDLEYNLSVLKQHYAGRYKIEQWNAGEDDESGSVVLVFYPLTEELRDHAIRMYQRPFLDCLLEDSND